MKERVKTVVIAILLVVTAVLCREIWISVPAGKKLIKTTDPTLSEAVTGRIAPASAIVNFGDGKHTKTYQLKNLWPFYRNLLKQATDRKDEITWERMDKKEYLEIQDEPSVIFNVGDASYSDIFKKIYHMENLKGDLVRLYFSEAEGILFETNRGVYRARSWTPLSDINKYVRSAEREAFLPYSSLWERYGISRAVYLPDEPPVFESGLIYHNELENMQGEYRNDLIQRLLNASIDDIHVIKEDDSVLYVYGKSNVRLSTSGILDYRNRSDVPKAATDPTGAVQLAYEFLTKTTGNVDSVYLRSIDAARDGARKGYRLILGYTEKGIDVIPVRGEPVDYIVVEVFDNRVEHVRYLYRNSIGSRASREESGLPFGAIIEKNPEIFGDVRRGYDRALKDLTGFSQCYIDDGEARQTTLRYGYRVEMGDEVYIFDAKTGELIGGDAK
ncbi:MAG: hypothetical protein SPI65_06280 [Peptoniphilus sp.]|nr:hypothetical protein [Peptoniphilus sp.]MDY6045162.1 hypothetical protein [Peptoniphilus sp.]